MNPERQRALLASLGMVPAEGEEPRDTAGGDGAAAFDGGARDSANEHPEGPERAHDETITAFLQEVRSRRYGA